jgi:1,2-phenylacetyl-CoA epoxidase catalytic subunit
VFHCLSALDQPFNGWVDFVATNFLVDTALTTLYEAAQNSSYDDLRNRSRRIMGEEQVHWLHGLAWVKRLANETDATRASIARSLTQLWPETVMWFGRTGDEPLTALLDRRVIDGTPDQMRERYFERIMPVLTEAGLADIAGQDLAWSRWDDVRFRLHAS